MCILSYHVQNLLLIKKIYNVFDFGQKSIILHYDNIENFHTSL